MLDFIRLLLSATANASLYGMSHPQVERLSSQARASICLILESRPEVTLLVIDNELIIDGQPQDLGLFLDRFTQTLKSHGVGSLKILPGITKSEIELLIGGLARQLDDGAQILASSDHIRLGKVDLRIREESDDSGTTASERPVLTLPDMPREELARFMEIYESVRNRQKIQINGVKEVVSGFINIFRHSGKPLLAMAALQDTDESTFSHSTNVSVLTLAQAIALGIEGQLLKEIGLAAMLHDIGKLFIPEEVILKTGKLTSEEFELIKQHPVRGARHLVETPGVPRLAIIVAYEHHLKFNLSGYPKVPADWQQNLCSHMTMISDVFDALRSRRSYREPMEFNQITVVMQNMMGTDLHPALTRNFLRIISGVMEANATPE